MYMYIYTCYVLYREVILTRFAKSRGALKVAGALLASIQSNMGSVGKTREMDHPGLRFQALTSLVWGCFSTGHVVYLETKKEAFANISRSPGSHSYVCVPLLQI